MSVGAAIREIRESKGLSQVEVAKKLYISPSMLCQIERGTKSLPFALSIELAEVLGCTIKDIADKALEK